MSAYSFRRFISICGLLALVALAAAGSVSGANAGNGVCTPVSGRVTLAPVPPAECASPLGLCATGSVRGGIRGTATIVTSSFIPSVDTPVTGVVFTTGDTTFVTAIGTLVTKDASTLSSITGEYVEIITVIGGTGAYAGASGTLFATGAASSESSTGSYRGEICTP